MTHRITGETPGSDALQTAYTIGRELVDQGARAVVAAGSFVRGDAHPESDLDLYALGSGSTYRLERRDRYLVSISFRTPDQVRQSFRTPREVGSTVPGWREALILHDPDGVAQALKSEANEWTWETVGTRACEAYLAESITGLAEEVHKLVISLERGNTWTAAVQRSIVALQLAPLMAVHLRLLYGSENRLWDLVGGQLGEPWRRAQGAALSDSNQSFEETCAAALELYTLAAAQLRPLLTPDQEAVVAHACRLAGTSPLSP